MTNSRLIQWPRAKYWDNAWNPIIGCKPCSPACEHCYAKAMTERFHKSFAPHASSKKLPPKNCVVFVGNMTDLFGEWRTCGEAAADIDATFGYGVIDFLTPYLFLTKRVARMAAAIEYATKHLNKIPKWWFGNHYFGFTAEDQAYYDWRSLDFGLYPQSLKGMNIWLSAEPLLGPIDLSGSDGRADYGRLKWVVVGCESGPKRRPCKIEWVESIVKQCKAAKVPVFVKQLSINGRCVTDINRFPAHLRIRQVPWVKKGNVK